MLHSKNGVGCLVPQTGGLRNLGQTNDGNTWGGGGYSNAIGLRMVEI